MPPSSVRIVLATNDVGRSDRISEALQAAGLDPLCCFSSGEAASIVTDEPPRAVLVDTELEDAEALTSWVRQQHRDTICLLHEFDHEVPTGSWDLEAGAPVGPSDEADDVAAKILRAIAQRTVPQVLAGGL